MNVDKIASGTANWIANSKGAQKLFNAISGNASKVSVTASNTVNFALRPVTIMATTKAKNLLDGAYCASSSIASGIGETITGATILKPLNKSITKSASELQASGFFQSIAKKAGSTAESAQHTFKSALGRIILIGLVPINGIIKMFTHPTLSHGIANLKTSLDKKGDKVNAVG